MIYINFAEPFSLISGGFRGGSRGSLEPPSGPTLFRFHGEFQKILCEIRQTNPTFLHLNPLFRNPGSAPADASCQVSRSYALWFWRRFLKVFAIYSHGGHLGYVTWTIYTNFRSPFLSTLHALVGPAVSEEKTFEHCGQQQRRSMGIL